MELVLWEKTVTDGPWVYRYCLTGCPDEIAFYGESLEDGRLCFCQRVENLPYNRLALIDFLEKFADSRTDPRMFLELVRENVGV